MPSLLTCSRLRYSEMIFDKSCDEGRNVEVLCINLSRKIMKTMNKKSLIIDQVQNFAVQFMKENLRSPCFSMHTLLGLQQPIPPHVRWMVLLAPPGAAPADFALLASFVPDARAVDWAPRTGTPIGVDIAFRVIFFGRRQGQELRLVVRQRISVKCALSLGHDG
jgi:hypothetical protein